jgi:hypothetical protein
MNNTDAIKQWQSLVGVTVDGVFGPQTTAATKTWQKTNGLVADGIVGPMTWAAAGFIDDMPTIKTGSGASSSSAYASSTPKVSPTPALKAGLFPWLGNLPTWAKAAIGVVVVASGYKLYKDRQGR